MSRGILRFNTALKGRGVSTPLGCKTALCKAGVKDAVRQGESGSLTLAPHSATRRKSSDLPQRVHACRRQYHRLLVGGE